MKLLLFSVVFYLAVIVKAQDCTTLANAGNCDFYTLCVEERFHCGTNGYPLAYGDKYCRRFINEQSCFTSAGRIWIDKVKSCLMKAILNSNVYKTNGTCDKLEEFAFDSHPSCYTDSGFCTDILSSPMCTNLICLASDVFDLKDFFTIRAIEQVYKTATICRRQNADSFLSIAADCIANVLRRGLVRAYELLKTLKKLLGDCDSGLDIVFVLDSSGSILENNFVTMKDFVKNIVTNFEIGADKTRVGVIRFSTSASIVIPLGSINNALILNNSITNIVYTDGGTATHLALNLLDTAFSNARTSEGIPRVAIVFTDGQSNSPSLTIQAAQAVHSTGIIVYSFGIGSGVNMNELNAIASTSSNVFLISNFSPGEFAAKLLPLQTSTCTTPAIASISKPLATSLGMGKSRLLQYPFPNEGITLKVDVTLGQVQVQGSFTIRNPTSLTADFSVSSTTNGIDYFISPGLYQSSIGGLQTSRRRRSPSNITTNVYLSIEGLQANNTFYLNTTFGDTSEDICRLPSEVGPCRGLYPRWFFNTTSSQCELFIYGGCQGNENQFGTLNECIDHCGCPFGQPAKICKLDVCSSVCVDYPNAVCYPDVCGDCFPRYFYGNDEVTDACDTGCEDDVKQVQCLHNPCDTAHCPNIPDAKCTPSSCGQCSAHFFNTSGHNVTSSCSSCPSDKLSIYCPINACDHQNCSNFPDAQCVLDNCGQCQAKFIVNGTEITDQCKSCTVQGAIFKPCGATCVDTCTTRRMNSSVICLPSCKPGCACPAGQIVDESSNRCVYPDQCSCPPCTPPPSNCSQLINDICGCTLCRDCSIEGQVYQQSHTCPRTCSNPDIYCDVNVTGCGCPQGQLIDEDRKRCVHPFDCPKTNPCHQPPFTGPFHGAFPRYFYNSTSQKCEKFIYGGGNANDNNFFTLHECQEQCSTCPPTCSYIFCGVRRDAICSIPMESGVDCQSDNCTITNCQACYYSNNILPFPQLLPSCPLGCENPLDEECMKKWGRCVRRSFLKIYNKILPQDVVPENFHCWNHKPCF